MRIKYPVFKPELSTTPFFTSLTERMMNYAFGRAGGGDDEENEEEEDEAEVEKAQNEQTCDAANGSASTAQAAADAGIAADSHTGHDVCQEDDEKNTNAEAKEEATTADSSNQASSLSSAQTAPSTAAAPAAPVALTGKTTREIRSANHFKKQALRKADKLERIETFINSIEQSEIALHITGWVTDAHWRMELFGSLVCGLGGPSSDLDIALLLPDAHSQPWARLNARALLKQVIKSYVAHTIKQSHFLSLSLIVISSF